MHLRRVILPKSLGELLVAAANGTLLGVCALNWVGFWSSILSLLELLYAEAHLFHDLLEILNASLLAFAGSVLLCNALAHPLTPFLCGALD